MRILVVLMTATALVACDGADARRLSHMKRGQEYFDQGNYEKARVEFRNALQITPNDAEARYRAGLVAEKLGNVREAIGMYQAAIDGNPDHEAARASLGRIFVFGGAPERALELVKPGLEKHPDSAQLLTVRSAARLQTKDRDGALADAERAVQLAPADESAVALLASLYRQTGEGARAIELVSGALEKIPSSVDLREVLASLYIHAGDFARAEEQLRKVIELQPRHLPARYRLAMFYVRNKRIDDAEKTLQQALAAVPDDDDAKLVYAEFLSSQRSREQAERALRDFIAKNPHDYDLQLGLGAFQQRAGATQDAIATYRKIVADAESGPKGLIARNRIAAIDVAQGRIAEAEALIAEVLKASPRDNDALTLRGNLALDRGDAATAIADLRAVLRDQPNAVPVLRTLARAHLANNEPALAEENLRAAIDAAPTQMPARVELAQLLMQTNRSEQAVALLEEAVKQTPTNTQAREALTRAYLAKGDLEAARTSADDLRTLAPKLAVGPYLAGLIAQEQKRYDDAEQDLEQALKLQPNALDALAALSRLQVTRGRAPAAIARVQTLVDADPQNAIARNLLGELHLQTHDLAAAARDFASATQSAPRWWLPYQNLALTRLASRDVDGAIAAYQSGMRETRDEPRLATALAALYEQQGRIDAAIQTYESLRKKYPKLEMVANNLAMLLATYRKDPASLTRARELTAPFARSDNGALLDTHGWVRLQLGDLDGALPVLERAADRAPQSPVIRYHLGMAQFKAGQLDKARTNLESALQGGSFAGRDEARATLAQLKSSSTG
ncbi:MAG TPA: tetratricopeptide repeat protein [Steroidobacteraceae bacterium]|nr:tetratricopeptide repeat protein [Steroidobacteraceae bacterium]